jgi:hypothetical protein
MALNFKQTNLAVNTGVDAITALLNSGKIQIYDGAQPATADTAIGSQVLLAELTFGATAFAAAVAGVAAANAITQDSSANASGTASWFRAVKSDGTAVFDGSVGTASANLIVNTTAIVAGVPVACSSLTYTFPKS